jgi:hypothetical protein
MRVSCSNYESDSGLIVGNWEVDFWFARDRGLGRLPIG